MPSRVIKMSDAVVSGSADKRQKINKKKKEQQIKRESMTAIVFISGIHRTNGNDNEQYSENLTRGLPPIW